MADKKARKAEILNESDRQDIIDVRRAKVLVLHSKGKTVREIADALLVGKSTIQEDIQFIRDQAAEEIQSHIQNLPFHHKRALTIADLVLKELFVCFDKSDLEIGDRLDVMKMILDTVAFRAKLLTDSGVLDRCVKHAEGLRKELDRFKKTQPSPSWEVIKEDDGKGDKRRTARKLAKSKEEAAPIV